jgi:hypothetical protein
MARTTADKVRDIIATDEDISLSGFIDTANAFVTWLSGQDSNGDLDDEMLELIERWLAAHFYSHHDQLLQSETAGGGGGIYQGQTGMMLLSTQYGQTAMALDVTGNLARRNQDAIDGKRKPRVSWGGTASDSPRPDQST